jgi:CHASE3 domain sensor protein
MDGSRSRQQRRLLLGVSLLLILCWMIGAIWLISMRRGERNMTEVAAQQRVIAASVLTKTTLSH